VFGCSRIRRRTGIFSFARYDPEFEIKNDGEVIDKDHPSHFNRVPIDDKDEETQNLIIHRACKTMTHEIVHMFGMKH